MNNQSLTYYQRHPHEAFLEGFVGNTSYESINETLYVGHKFFIPRGCVKRANFLKKYFNYIDQYPEEPRLRRRQNWVEWAEAVSCIFQRIDSFITRKHLFLAGSQYVSPVPWAAFGETTRMAQNNFTCLVDISRYYRNFLHGDCRAVQTHFTNKGPETIKRIAKRFHQKPLNSPNFWFGVAVCLVYDLIHNCGPDCAPVFELFCNDYRLGPDDMDLKEWEHLRCKILGCEVNPLSGLPRPKITYKPYKPEKSKIHIEMGEYCLDLSIGEKSELTTRPKTVLCLLPAMKDREVMGPPLPPGMGTNKPCEPPIPHDMRDIYTRMKYGRGRMFCGPLDHMQI